uniref:Probable JmjC domain-containing histone demethylation protein 2C n=1 Tax=Vombatus ursinus TaxID=29139 RepID=A0A4X2L6I7_VOMUR
MSDYSECSDSETSNKRMTDPPYNPNAGNEVNKNNSKINGDEGKSQRREGAEEQAVNSQSLWGQIQEAKRQEEAENLKPPSFELKENPLLSTTEKIMFYDPNVSDLHSQERKTERAHTMELLPKEQFVSKPPTPKCVIDITNETSSEKVVQENSTRIFGFQALQKMESLSSDSKLLFSNSKFLETKKPEPEQSWVSSMVHKMDLASPVLKNPFAISEPLIIEKDKDSFSTYRTPGNAAEDHKPHKPNPPPEIPKPKFPPSGENLKPKANTIFDVIQAKFPRNTDSTKSKAGFSNSGHAAGERRLTHKTQHDLPRSSFHPVSTRGLETAKNPLIDKNDHFTAYRDPALAGQESGTNHVPSFLSQHTFPHHSSSHRTCHNQPTLSAPTHLAAGSSNQSQLPSLSHPSNSSAHSSVHPHMASTALPGVPPASLLGGPSRVEAAHSSHLAIAHHQHQHHHHHHHQQQPQPQQQQQPQPQQQQQMLQHSSPHLLGQAHPPASSYNQLGLYPVLWQYPNGPPPYTALSMPTSKWLQQENAANAEASLRGNTPSPWLHQPTPVTSADGLGLLSHIPVRPSSADPHRPLKMTTHPSPPLSKALVDHHKEELERKAFIEPLRAVVSMPVKNDLDRIQVGQDSHLPRPFVDSMLSQFQRPVQDTGERMNKYKEEPRRVLQESVEVSPFTTKMKTLEGERESYSRITPLSSASPISQTTKQDKDGDRSVSELYSIKPSAPQSNYFTTISSTVVNEPPRSYPSKEVSGLFTDKQSNNPSTVASPQVLTSFMSSLSKPPPLIKHQPEGEGMGSKLAEQLPQQMPSHSVTAFGNDCRSPTHLTVSSSNPIRSMPALHRAPVFHPPIHPSLDRKESTYSSLSPPTLTPVLPVNAGGKVQELQKPPTLVPEPKDAQAIFKNASEHSLSEMWRSNNAPGSDKVSWHVEKSIGKAPVATASVIVCPPSSGKYESVPAMQPAPKERGSERSSFGVSPADGWKPVEAREVGRVILPNSNLALPPTHYEKNFEAAPKGRTSSSIIKPATPGLCSTKKNLTPVATTTASAPSWGASEVTFSFSSTVLTPASLQCISSRSVVQPTTHIQECRVSTIISNTAVTSKIGWEAQPSSEFSNTPDFIHLKKHKAVMAATQFKSGSGNEAEPDAGSSPPCSAPTPLESPATCSMANKVNTVGSGQNSQTSQPNYHTKLKKAWLTRHSEEDKNSNKMESSENTVSEIIKPCSVNLVASTSSEIHSSVESTVLEDKPAKEDKTSRKKMKRSYESGSESGGDSDGSESKAEQRTKRQPKPTYKKKQNDLQKRKGELEEEARPNGVLVRSSREKNKLKLPSNNNNNNAGIPRSVLKDWRKVKKLKQTGESFLQDDSCYEIGPNLQKCRECRLIRNKKGEEPTHSPVFCRFYYFRRLSFSKNGVVRIDGFSSPDQYDDEALSLWTHERYDDDELDLETSKYILGIIGDKFCQLVTSEKTALSWVKKDAKIAWKRAVRGVREMCDACEATLFNIHWVCQKCGFVVCLDCYKAKERKRSRDKELYAWMKCVKGQPHDHKHLMPTQIIPGSVLTDLLDAMHNLREKFDIRSDCVCTDKQNVQVETIAAMNGVPQVLQNVHDDNNTVSLCMPESQQQNSPQKSETNGNTSPRSDVSTDSKLTPPESQSPLHWLADLAEQKAREEKKENTECPLGKHIKEESDQDIPDSPDCKTPPAVSQNNEQGSTLRDLLTTTAGKLRVGSTDAGIAFAPVYSTGAPSGQSERTVPNILDDIIASVVENKIPPHKASKIEEEEDDDDEEVEIIKVIEGRGKGGVGGGDRDRDPEDGQPAAMDESDQLSEGVPHSWMCEKHVLWLQDHKNLDNWKLFKQCWKQGQPVVVSGVHKKMNISLWKAESISLDFGDHQADLLNCKDSIISNANVKEFWDGFEDISKRQKIKSGETVVLKLKDCPSGEDFKTMMPARYEDLFRSLPLPEYCNPEGKFNLASHLPGFFVRPDLGPRLCSAYGVAAAKDHDIGTTNLHIEVSDVVNILVYVGVAKGNGVLSKSGVLKKFEEEDLDDLLRRRLKDSSETPGALWHIYAGKDADKIREFLQKITKEQGLEVLPEHDPIRDQSWYVNKKLRQRLLEEYGVKTCTVVQFLGDAIILPAGALHQVQNFHSCIQVTEDFVSPEHLVQSFHLTQELRLLKEEINYDDKLQVRAGYLRDSVCPQWLSPSSIRAPNFLCGYT